MKRQWNAEEMKEAARDAYCSAHGDCPSDWADPTGNRRWLPFDVESIEPPHENPLDYRSIYSQTPMRSTARVSATGSRSRR